MYLYLLVAAQIIIEMLPISSSGHLMLLDLFLKKYALNGSRQFFDTKVVQAFYYFLHGPTLLIIIGYFSHRWLQLLIGPQGVSWQLLVYVIVADMVTALLYWLLKRYSLDLSLGIGFIITAIALLSTAWCSESRSLLTCSLADALILGAAQGIALLPGISRLAFTSSIGCLLGFCLYDAFFISWTLQAPLMAAAFLKSVKDLYQLRAFGQILNLPTALVMLTSSGLSIFIMGIVLHMAQSNTLYYFGWYMIIPCIAWAIIRSNPNSLTVKK